MKRPGFEHRIVFDVTDFIAYSHATMSPTGIQRVVERLLGSQVLQQAPDVFFVFRTKNADTFWSFDKSLLSTLRKPENKRNAIVRPRALDQNREDRFLLTRAQARPWKFLKRKYRDASRRVQRIEIMESCVPFQVRASDVLVIPGAFWIDEDISQLYAQLRQRHQLRLVLFVYDLIP